MDKHSSRSNQMSGDILPWSLPSTIQTLSMAPWRNPTFKKTDFLDHSSVIHDREHAFVRSILSQWQEDSLINQGCKQDSQVHHF